MFRFHGIDYFIQDTKELTLSRMEELIKFPTLFFSLNHDLWLHCIYETSIFIEINVSMAMTKHFTA